MLGRRESDPFGEVLQRLHDERDRYFGTPHVSLRRLTQDTRRFSDILRVRVQADAARYDAFVKVLKPQGSDSGERDVLRERVAAEYATTVRVRDYFAGQGGFSTVRPIACFPDHLALVTEEARGETFVRVLERHAAWRPRVATMQGLCAVAEKVGRWLRAFQDIETPGRQVSLDGMREYLDVRLQQLVRTRCAGFSSEDRQAVLRFFDTSCRDIGDGDLREVPIHADLALSNVMVDGTDMTVIDFGGIKWGAIHHDLTHVFMQLDLLALKPQFSRGVLDELQAALLRGFDATLDRSKPMFVLLLLLHVLCHFATVSTRAGEGAEWLYNQYVRRRHRHWLDALLDTLPAISKGA